MSAAWFLPPKVVTFTEFRAFGEASLGSIAVRQAWTAHPTVDGVTRYDVHEYELGAEGEKLRESWRVRLDADGLWHEGPIDAEGQLSAWSPPLRLLPAQVAPGAWPAALHRREDKEIERTLDVLESAVFANSVAVVSDTRAPGVRILWRDHYVEDVGWVGYEGMILRPQGQMRIWSEGMTRDGVPAPLPLEDGLV